MGGSSNATFPPEIKYPCVHLLLSNHEDSDCYYMCCAYVNNSKKLRPNYTLFRKVRLT